MDRPSPEPGAPRPTRARLRVFPTALAATGLALRGWIPYAILSAAGVAPWVLARRSGALVGEDGAPARGQLLYGTATLITTTLALAAIVHRATGTTRGRRDSFGASLRAALRRAPTCAGLALRTLGHLALFVAPAALLLWCAGQLLLRIVLPYDSRDGSGIAPVALPAIVSLGGWLSMHLPAVPYAILDGTDAWTSFDLARRLTFGRRARIFAILLLSSVVPSAALLAAALAPDVYGGWLFPPGIPTLLVAAAVGPFLGAAAATVHVELRRLDGAGGRDVGDVFD